jgi:hypothetical protein
MTGKMTLFTRATAICAVLALALPLAAVDFSTQPGAALPDGTPDAVKALVRAEGVVVKSPDGK